MRPLLLVMFLLVTSCSTVIKRSTYTLKVISVGEDDKVEVDGNIYSLPADVTVKRSKEDLRLRLISDTTSIDFTVEAYPSGAFLYGNLLWVSVCPVAYAIDLTNPKRFQYGKLIILDPRLGQHIESPIRKDVNGYFSEKFPKQKGDAVFTVSLPFINLFYLQPETPSPRYGGGIFGLSTGIEYYHKDLQYLSLTTGIVADGTLGEQFEGPWERMSSTYLTLTNNHQLNRFHFGYGLNLSRNRWIWENLSEPTDPDEVTYIKEAGTSVGVTANVYHQTSDNFVFGIVYRPTFYCFDPTPKWTYEHVISFDIKARIDLFHSRKKHAKRNNEAQRR